MRKNITLVGFVLILSLYLFVPKLGADSKLMFPDLEPDISMDFQDANLKDVMKVLSIQAGLNFVASQAVQDRKLTLYLDKVPLRDAMDKIFIANNLSYELDRDSNVFIVKDWGKPTTETVTRVFYLKNATVSSSSIKEEMANQIRTSTTTGGTTGGGSGTGKWKSEDDSGITKAVKKLLSDIGQVIEDYRTNSLIVTDTPQRIEIITQVIAALDIPIAQVMLEVEMLDVSKNVVDKMGFKWNNPLAGISVPGSKFTKFPFGSGGTSAQGSSMSVTDFPGVGNTGAWDIGPWGGAHFGPSVLTILGQTIDFDFLRTLTDAKVLARPRIMTLNNETAEIKITTQEAIGSITSQTGGTSPLTTVTAERVETGVTLRVTPQINTDTGEITMVILPTVKDATPSSLVVQTGANKQSFKDPEERGTKSIVKVRDGETVIIGGLIRHDRSETETKVPVFGDIPVLGAFFRHKNKDKDRERELLVFITPHIIKDQREVKLAQTKKASLPQREQTVISGARRELEISSALSRFETR